MARTDMRSRDHGRLRPLFQVASVLLLLCAVTVHVQFGDRIKARPSGPPVRRGEDRSATPGRGGPVGRTGAGEGRGSTETRRRGIRTRHRLHRRPRLPPLDRAAVARAEAALDEASRDRARAEARADDAAGRLAAATKQAALDAAMARKLAFRIRDPSAQINRVAARGGFLKADRDKLKAEVAALRTLPRPKATSILSKTPVARPTTSDEFHFELRRNRISFINLDRLMELAKADAQVRIRMSDRSGLITSQVGPVGSFSLGYILGRASGGIDELIERQSIRFDLKGWELIPEIGTAGRDLRGDPQPDLPVLPRRQPAHPRPVDRHLLGLPRQLHPLPPPPRRARRPRLQRRRPPPPRRHDDPRQPDGLGLGGTVSPDSAPPRGPWRVPFKGPRGGGNRYDTPTSGLPKT